MTKRKLPWLNKELYEKIVMYLSVEKKFNYVRTRKKWCMLLLRQKGYSKRKSSRYSKSKLNFNATTSKQKFKNDVSMHERDAMHERDILSSKSLYCKNSHACNQEHVLMVVEGRKQIIVNLKLIYFLSSLESKVIFDPIVVSILTREKKLLYDQLKNKRHDIETKVTKIYEKEKYTNIDEREAKNMSLKIYENIQRVGFLIGKLVATSKNIKSKTS